MIDIEDFQLSLDDLQQELSAFKDDGSVLTVGVHEAENAREDSELTNAQIGVYNHFGTENIPARPFLDVGVMSGAQSYSEALEELQPGNLQEALETIGVFAQSAVQEYMTDLRVPPNALSTIKKKGSSNPLIDTEELRSSIKWVVSKQTITEGV